ncbi:MAG: hypothetical protein CBC12_02825 [Candidatus Puniceispirillum sp. TMED52]|nr:MAG: hypothetical protein CBC12_02825 [Candidatus Puniceispirillum sp. TMED52]RPF82340.1 MAG: hypothetical protein CBC65_000545 [Rhodothermaceae bacterium TMED105]
MQQPQITISRALIPSNSVIDDEGEKTYYYDRLMKSWTGTKNRKLPQLGSNPVSLSRQNLKDLRNGDYVVGLKSDGIRYILYLCLRKDGSPVSLMVDRAQNMYEVEVVAQEEYFTTETIFEGELVWSQPDETSLLFLMFDVVRLKGESMTNRPFIQRIEAVERCTRLSDEISLIGDLDEMESRVSETGSIVIMKFNPRLIVRPKRFVAIEHTIPVWEARAEAQHRVDGLVIQRSDAPYKNGSAYNTIYKWKPEHSVDLSGGHYGLCHAGGTIDEDIFHNRKIVVLPSRVTVSSNSEVAEYHLDTNTPGEVRLFAMRTRPDKKKPNSAAVIKATIQDCIENIQPNDISDAASSMDETQ